MERNDGKKSLQTKSGCYSRSVSRGFAEKALSAEDECVLASVGVPFRTHGGGGLWNLCFVNWCFKVGNRPKKTPQKTQ